MASSLEEPYLLPNEKKAKKLGLYLMYDFDAITVPDHEVFVIGDNRTISMDSRNDLGSITKDRIAGKAEFVFFPFEKIKNKIIQRCNEMENTLV
jgi:signal peptidase I